MTERMKKVTDKSKSYKTLIVNMITFALSTFGSKLLVIILVPLYTSALSPDQYGAVDLITQTANILIPIFTLAISEAALRFGLDAKDDASRKKVYTICLGVMAAGLFAMAAIFPALSRLDYIKGYSAILYIYVWTSSFRQLGMFFARALEKVRLFAIDGVLCTLAMLLLNILFLLKFKWGIMGYLLAIILSDVISGLFLFFGGKMWKYVSFRAFDAKLARTMVKYAAPLMSATLLWLVTSISDRFIIKYFHGVYLTGIITAAYKIPLVLTTVFTMFSQAWNMSAISENGSEMREELYTDVFRINQSFMYVLSAGILFLNRPITFVWLNSSYSEAYRYSPILTLATVFNCFSVFLGSVYIAEKKTKNSFLTSIAAALVNITLNLILIPQFRIYGAAIATLAAYLIVFFVRLFDTRRYIPFDFSMTKILLNTTLLIAMTAVNLMDFLPAYAMYSILAAAFAAALVINLKDILRIVVFLVPKKLKTKIKLVQAIERYIK